MSTVVGQLPAILVLAAGPCEVSLMSTVLVGHWALLYAFWEL